jgi:type IV pilus assembly protein PilM
MMHFYVIRNGQQLFSREQAFGGNQLTQDIQRAFNLSSEEAESAKRNGGLPDNYEIDVLQPFTETLALEVARALQFFFTSTTHTQVEHILLAGGCALIAGLDEIVAKRTNINTLVANPFSGMGQPPKIRPQQLAVDAPMLLIATGLALRRFEA